MICTGESSEFGQVFKMMQTEEVSQTRRTVCIMWDGLVFVLHQCDIKKTLFQTYTSSATKDATSEEHEFPWQAALILLTVHHWSVRVSAPNLSRAHVCVCNMCVFVLQVGYCY